MLASLLLAAALAPRSEARALEVRVDPRTEALAAVALLAGPGSEARPDWLPALRDDGSPYARALKERFAPLAGDPAVKTYRELEPLGLDALTGLDLMVLAFTPELEFDAARVPPHLSDALSRERQPKRYERLVELGRQLERFAARGRLLELLAGARRPALAALERRVRGRLESRDYAGALEAYSGLAVPARATVFVCPLLNTYASTTVTDAGAPLVLAFVGPPAPGEPERGRYAGLERRIFQELAHAALDGAAGAYAAELRRSERLFDPKTDRCESWLNCAREHVAKAVSWRLVERERRDAPSAREAAPDPVTRALIARLAEYEADRRRYPTLKDFYPRLVDALTAQAQAQR